MVSDIKQDKEATTLMSRRGGNYILTIGMPRSGKTTFQNFLIRYLMEGNDFKVIPRTVDGQPVSKLLLGQWEAEWAKGDIVAPTVRGQPKEFAFELSPLPKSKYKEKLAFGFFEVSGENLRAVMFNANEAAKEAAKPGLKVAKPEQKLPLGFLTLLNNRKINWLIVLMCDGAELGQAELLERDDTLFSDFLVYLEKKLSKRSLRKLREQGRLMLIISKPADAEAALENSGRQTTEPIAVQIARTYLKKTSKEIQSWGQPPLVGLLRIGKILPEEEEGKEVGKLREPDFRHMAQIFGWIYGHFTGISPEPGFFERKWQAFLKFFRE